jgi:hypothetical protein
MADSPGVGWAILGKFVFAHPKKKTPSKFLLWSAVQFYRKFILAIRFFQPVHPTQAHPTAARVGHPICKNGCTSMDHRFKLHTDES